MGDGNEEDEPNDKIAPGARDTLARDQSRKNRLGLGQKNVELSSEDRRGHVAIAPEEDARNRNDAHDKAKEQRHIIAPPTADLPEARKEHEPQHQKESIIDDH